jgi:PII-like signaling protein
MLQAQIYINRDELKGSQPLYEFIMQFLTKQKILGATAFRGQIGFGDNQMMKRPNDFFSFDEVPMLITFIDEDEKVRTTLTELRKLWVGGFIITYSVEQWQ